MATMTMERKQKRTMALQDYRPYADALEKLDKLQGRRAELEKRLEGLGGNTPKHEHLQRDAERLLQSDNIAAVGNLRDELGEARREAAVVDKAIELAQAIASREKAQAAVAVGSSRLPEHIELARNIGEALKDLRAALLAEQAFRHELENVSDTGLCGPLRCATFSYHGKGCPDMLQQIDSWFIEARENGYGTEDKV